MADVHRNGGKIEKGAQALAGKKVVVLYFSAQWCPPCRIFMPILKEFYEVLYASHSILALASNVETAGSKG